MLPYLFGGIVAMFAIFLWKSMWSPIVHWRERDCENLWPIILTLLVVSLAIKIDKLAITLFAVAFAILAIAFLISDMDLVTAVLPDNLTCNHTLSCTLSYFQSTGTS